MIILVTCAVRFIRSALALRLLERGDTVIGVINHNNYYDPAIKKYRLARFSSYPKYSHLRIDLMECKSSWDDLHLPYSKIHHTFRRFIIDDLCVKGFDVVLSCAD